MTFYSFKPLNITKFSLIPTLLCLSINPSFAEDTDASESTSKQQTANSINVIAKDDGTLGAGAYLGKSYFQATTNLDDEFGVGMAYRLGGDVSSSHFTVGGALTTQTDSGYQASLGLGYVLPYSEKVAFTASGKMTKFIAEDGYAEALGYDLNAAVFYALTEAISLDAGVGSDISNSDGYDADSTTYSNLGIAYTANAYNVRLNAQLSESDETFTVYLNIPLGSEASPQFTTFTSNALQLANTTWNSSLVKTEVVETETTDTTNSAPTASDVSLDANGFGNEVVTHNLNANISDAEDADSALSITVVTAPTHGSLTWSGNTFTYTVTQGSFYAGSDSFTYYVTDSDGAISSTQTVSISNIFDS